jgi:DNA-binding response OmpR family regulator
MAQGQRPRILVVDDELDLTDLLAALLEDEGYSVDRAYDGEQALQIVRSNSPPDLMLSDVMLPKVGGVELVAATRRLHLAEQLPIILISAGPDPGLHLDCVSFMAKPLDLDQLLDRVAALTIVPPHQAPFEPSASDLAPRRNSLTSS